MAEGGKIIGEYEFTQDWFSFNIPAWESILGKFPARTCVLEIGSFEGRSAVWLMENAINNGGSITCIDTWKGGWEHDKETMDGTMQRFTKNMDIAKAKTGIDYYMEWGESHKSLSKLISGHEEYDFIYVDGSHSARDVLSDAVMAYHLLCKGGIMCFDDYFWGPADQILERPKLAIDAFCNIYAKDIDFLGIGTQVWVKKK